MDNSKKSSRGILIKFQIWIFLILFFFPFIKLIVQLISMKPRPDAISIGNIFDTNSLVYWVVQFFSQILLGYLIGPILVKYITKDRLKNSWLGIGVIFLCCLVFTIGLLVDESFVSRPDYSLQESDNFIDLLDVYYFFFYASIVSILLGPILGHRMEAINEKIR